MNNKKLLIWETALVAAIYSVAVFLHFFYELSSYAVLGALLGAVNESVWEHLKIFVISYAFWAGIEYLALKPPLKRFVAAKTVAVYSLMLLISGFFYLYTAFTKKSFAAVDITASFIFLLLSQFFSYLLLTRWEKADEFFLIFIFLLLFLLFSVLCLSVYPPKIGLFRDPLTGLYGIIPENIDRGAAQLSALCVQNLHANIKVV